MKVRETNVEQERMGYPWQPDEEPVAEVDLIDLLYRLVDKLKYVVLAALVGALIFGYWAKENARIVYTADASLYVLNSDEELIFSDIQMANSMMNNYLAIFTNVELHQAVINRLGLTYTPSEMASMVSVANTPGTHIINVLVYSTKEREAVRMANAYVAEASKFISQVMHTGQSSVWEEATMANRVHTPDVGQAAMRGAFGGAMILFALVVVQVILDERVRTPDQLEQALGVRTLGVMTRQKKNREDDAREFYE